MNIKNIKHKLLCLLAVVLGFTSCVDNDFSDNKGTFYSSTKLTVAEFINQNLDRFSSFKAILEKGNYFTTLATYGTYTVYLPTNDAIATYLSTMGFSSVDDMPVALCDTLSRSHIISKGAYFTSDYSEGKLPEMNMDDHFIVLSNDSDANKKLQIFVNQNSQIIEKDDSMTNGVVHVVNRPLTSSNEFIAEYLQKDTAITLFTQALQATQLDRAIAKYLDESYSCGEDSVRGEIPTIYYGGHDHTGSELRYPDKRYFKYTLFVETDAVYKKSGINNLDDLKAFAKKVYDPVFPEDANITDITNPRNSFNRFVAYHIIDRIGAYTDWAPSGDIYANNWKPEVADAEDYWETMAPGQIIRFVRLSGGKLYANRKGKGASASLPGVYVLNDSESRNINNDPKLNRVSGALNGTYLYLNDMLYYDTKVRDMLLNTRMRIDATTLSPDFMNEDGRGHYGKHILTAFKNKYITNFKLSDETILAVHNDDMWWSSYLGNAIGIKGRFDVSFKLPPVPTGQYEIRLGYVCRDNGSTMQVYISEDGKETPCGIPFDQTIGSWDARVGFMEDKTENDIPNDEERLAYNKSIDKAMRNRGYMKAMDSYRKGTGATSFRIDAAESLRRILTTVEIDNRKEYWLRFRKADNTNPDSEFSFDYIEIVPSNVYNNPNGEDQH